jgi:hypothetical protein
MCGGIGGTNHCLNTLLTLPSLPPPPPCYFLDYPQVCHAVKSHKSLKRAGIGQRLVHEVLCIQLQKDGSDTWRLEPVVEILKQGGVSDGGGGAWGDNYHL